MLSSYSSNVLSIDDPLWRHHIDYDVDDDDDDDDLVL